VDNKPLSFRELELLNVKIDVWIDEEEFDKIENELSFKKLNDINNFFDLDNSKSKKKINSPEKFIKFLQDSEKLRQFYDFGKIINYKEWIPLLWAKFLRAKVKEADNDKFTKLLDYLVVYLLKSIPYVSSSDEDQQILLHLYFQELSACGMPGLESLGYAMQAERIIKEKICSKKNSGKATHYDLKLYELWASLNKGIGYSHSFQKNYAEKELCKVIRIFDTIKIKNSKEKELWRSLLYDQAVLHRAEIHEEMQFSYHTIKTIEKLGDRKRENGLIKRALAFSDMGRIEEAKDEIVKLLDHEKENGKNNIENIFKMFNMWDLNNKKKDLRSKILGLLFDFCLKDIETLENNRPRIDKEEQVLFDKFLKYKDDFLKYKNERSTFFYMLAKFIKWLSKKEWEKEDKKKEIKKREIDKKIKTLYKILNQNFSKKDDFKKRMKEFDEFFYEKFIKYMEKFYKKMSNMSGENKSLWKKKEIYFLTELNKFEEKQGLLLNYNKSERVERIAFLKNNKTNSNDFCKCSKPKICRGNSDCSFACFGNGKTIQSFYEVLSCVNKSNHCKNGKISEIPIAKKNSGNPRPYINNCLGPLIAYDYESIMWKQNQLFLDYLKHKSRHQLSFKKNIKIKSTFHFVGLQRWNSQTPTLTLSRGGGYLLYEQDDKGDVTLGIAIDPGFDFVDNLFHMGFTLNDIDFILLSHAHLDHIRDFEPIVASLLELKKQDKKSQKKIHAIMSFGVYNRLKHIITNPTLREFLADTYIIDIDKDINPNEYLHDYDFVSKSLNNRREFISSIKNGKNIEKNEIRIKIKPTRAYHNDYTEESDSFGFIIDIFYQENKKDPGFSFGYTGDSRWHKDIHSQYSECDAVCFHLGALIQSEDERKNKFSFYKKGECEELLRSKQHPYLFGLLRYIKLIPKKSKNKLLLISEFGEELKGGIRVDLIRRLNGLIESCMRDTDSKPICLPVDIGLNTLLYSRKDEVKESKNKADEHANSYQTWCYGCERYVDTKHIQYRHYGFGRDEALFYFCEVCLKTLPENIIQEKMHQICEVGLPLNKADPHENG